MPTDVLVYVFLIIYKITILGVGISSIFMGYRLFALDKVAATGNLEAGIGVYSLKISQAAPGIFFSLFGTIVICISIFKGVEFKREAVPAGAVPGVIASVSDTTTQIEDKAIPIATETPVVVIPARPPS